MFLLNHFCYPFPGDDYVYSFIWEGHAIGVPLSEEAVRIQSFSDVFTSLDYHYMTWSGRLVAYFFLMFFLWIGKFWFNFINAAMVLMLCFCIQWLAHEGRITLDISINKLALTFFCSPEGGFSCVHSPHDSHYLPLRRFCSGSGECLGL